MLTLYSKESCPFCHRVLEIAQNLNIELDVKDIEDDELLASELVERGGKQQVPYLVDTDKGVSMYESSDIIDYIRDNYASTGTAAVATKPRIHMSDATCVSCEG